MCSENKKRKEKFSLAATNARTRAAVSGIFMKNKQTNLLVMKNYETQDK